MKTTKKLRCKDCGKPQYYLFKDKWCWNCYNENSPDEKCLGCGYVGVEVLNRLCDYCWQRREDRLYRKAHLVKRHCTKCKTNQYGVVAGVCERCSVLIGLPPLKTSPEVFHANRVELKKGDRQQCHA